MDMAKGAMDPQGHHGAGKGRVSDSHRPCAAVDNADPLSPSPCQPSPLACWQ